MSIDHQDGVLIDHGAVSWQIFQQDARGAADLRLAGRWLTTNPFKQAVVMIRVVREDNQEAVTRSLDWAAARTGADGSWSAVLRRVPAGGLYRIETCLRLDAAAVEWSQHGQMVHHVGVGDIWVITGQSNAAGYGKAPVTDPPELGIHMFHASGEWRLATHPLGDSTRTRYPANREAANASHSPWIAFGRALKNGLGYPIGLIPASLGGSPIQAWVRQVDGCLFDNMLAYVRDAGGRVRGVVWYQGESDTGPNERRLYAARFKRLVRDLRKHLKRPDLPVITAQLNRCVGEPLGGAGHRGWDEMREIQRCLAATLDHVYVISTLGLGLSDGIHTDSLGNLVIGERMASVALGAVHGKPVKYLHPDLRRARRVSATQIDLVFDNVDTRLHYENNIIEQFPFAVRDEQGEIPVLTWSMPGANRLRLKLARPMSGAATITGAPSAAPPFIVPFDIAGYRPMLAFTAPIT